MLKRYLWGAGVVTVVAAALLLTPQVSEAQRRGGGGYRGGWGGSRGGGWGGYGGGWGGSRGGWGGYRGGWGGYYGYPGYGLGLGYGRYGGYYGYPSSYGYSSSYYGYPSSGYYSTYPSYSYSSVPSYTYSPDTYAYGGTTQSYQSFYPPDTSGRIIQAGGRSVNPNETRVRVRVPDPNAEVLFDGQPTRQRGSERAFVTEMDPGTKGTYQVTARWNENGKMHEETRNVRVQAGQTRTVDFTQSQGTSSVNPTPRPAVTGEPAPAPDRVNPNPRPRDDSLNRNPGAASRPANPKDDNPRP